MAENLLKVENATMQFGGVVAVDNLNLEVNQGEIVALIGPNGAGKTTAFNVITGVYAPTNGRVWFNGERIAENFPKGKMKKLYKGQHAGEYTHTLVPTPDKITKLGMARTFQNIRLWKSQTVFENVLIGMHLRRTSNLFTATFRLNAKEEAAQRAEVERLLEIVGLSEERNELATALPYGKQRRLEIARALATQPKLLLLDEPSLGLAPLVVQDIFTIVQEINKQGMTVLLIEQNANMALKIADLAYVLETGNITMSGTGAELLADEKVKEAYLGKHKA